MTESSEHVLKLSLAPEDHMRLAILNGPIDENLKYLRKELSIDIRNIGHQFTLSGQDKTKLEAAAKLIKQLYKQTVHQAVLDAETLHLFIHEHMHDGQKDGGVNIQTPRLLVRSRGLNQEKYLTCIERFDINFGIGPAGTGKTYLAVACAAAALVKEDVKRILLVRPAVEAGEKLGFLPGDLAQKVDPYLRPLYDALYDMLGFEQVERLIDKSVIEVAPLAFMRGRTLNNAFIILDESQNTTPEQMKMFLTRIGFGSTAVITGDATQIDLPKGAKSGLTHAAEVLKDVKGISFTHFTASDVVRHPLVQRIVEAYEQQS